MPQSVNLLGWRAVRRQQMIRFWTLMFSIPLLIFSELLAIRQGVHRQTIILHETCARNHQALVHGLMLREQQMKSLLAQQEQRRRREQQRAQTLNWQPALLALAGTLPEQAWLTAMEWKSGVLSLKGLAWHFSALAALDKSLHAWSAFPVVNAGATRKDPQGRWQFSYQLNRDSQDAEDH